MGWVVNATPRPLYMGWVDSRAGLDQCGRFRPHQDLIADRPARRQSLYRPTISVNGKEDDNFLISLGTISLSTVPHLQLSTCNRRHQTVLQVCNRIQHLRIIFRCNQTVRQVSNRWQDSSHRVPRTWQTSGVNGTYTKRACCQSLGLPAVIFMRTAKRTPFLRSYVSIRCNIDLQL
jgi:hypothetical protein